MLNKVLAVLLSVCIVAVGVWAANSSNMTQSDVGAISICDMEPGEVSY